MTPIGIIIMVMRELLDSWFPEDQPSMSALTRPLAIAWLTLLLVAAPPAIAAKGAPLRCVPDKGTSGLDLARVAADTRLNDSFYNQLVNQMGQPSSCKGSVGQGEATGESRLEFTWPDGSRFEQSALLPETSVVRYSNVRGLAHADALSAALRKYAARRGLRIDWTSPHQHIEPGARVIEYQDPAPGVNGIARLVYDRQQRLVAIFLSTAL